MSTPREFCLSGGVGQEDVLLSIDRENFDYPVQMTMCPWSPESGAGAVTAFLRPEQVDAIIKELESVRKRLTR